MVYQTRIYYSAEQKADMWDCWQPKGGIYLCTYYYGYADKGIKLVYGNTRY